MSEEHNLKAIRSSLSCYVIRLCPGDDLVLKLLKFAKENEIKAGFILTCVGSLSQANLRMAGTDQYNKATYLDVAEKTEIVSLVGTLSCNGEAHLHTSLSNNNGVVVGGHLMSTGGAIVRTTAEVVIGCAEKIMFERPFDKETGYGELKVKGI